MITVLTLLPLIGGLVLLASCRSREAARVTAFLFAGLSFVLVVLLWFGFNPATPGMQFVEQHEWAPSLGIAYHVGADGLSVLMVTLSAIVVLMSLAASWANSKHDRTYYVLVLFLESGLFGTFTALNFVHWFIFWELSLIPAYFLVRLWGGPQRARAANQFFLYTMVGSVALLLAF
ncbi:MAG TPA: proton-conducting transporter membrane subunit, partial [Acidobacteriaceae bacterium]|nr:proton-conducting transporter membrane subunit [Acidobacteriaceae bacterium]